MARDTTGEPMSDTEFDAFEQAMGEQAEDLREALAEDLGGEPEDYQPGRERVADGGEE